MNKESPTGALASAADSFSRSALMFIGALGLVVLVWVVYYMRHYEGLAVIDALDTAQAARHLASGDGFVTGFLRPGFPETISGSGPIPDLYNSPGYVLVLAAFFRWLGASSQVATGASVCFGLACCLAVFAAVWRRAGYRWALLAMLVCGISPGFIEASFSGLGIPFCSLLFLGFGALLPARESPGRSLILGGLWGILALADLDFLLLLPAAVFGLWRLDRDLRGLLYFFLAVLAILSPWLIRNLAVAGNPLSSWRWAEFFSWTGSFPGNRVFRDPDWAMEAIAIADIPAKAAIFSRLMYPYWLVLGGLPVAAIFFVGLLRGDINGRVHRAGLLLGLLLASEALVIALTDPNSVGMFLAFFPTLILYTTVFVFAWSGPLGQGLRLLAPTLMIILPIVIPGMLAAYFGQPPTRYFTPAYPREAIARLEEGVTSLKIMELVKEDETLLSDSPWAVSWYAHRDAVWIPWELEQVRDLQKVRSHLDSLHLTPIVFRYPPDENPAAWQEIYATGRVPAWFGFEKGIMLPGEEILLGRRVLERLDLE